VSSLNELFIEENIVKISMQGERLIMDLQRDFGIYVIGLQDVGIMAESLDLNFENLQSLS
jgi:hypothetical protein